jgi:hypothetical protein
MFIFLLDTSACMNSINIKISTLSYKETISMLYVLFVLTLTELINLFFHICVYKKKTLSMLIDLMSKWLMFTELFSFVSIK